MPGRPYERSVPEGVFEVVELPGTMTPGAKNGSRGLQFYPIVPAQRPAGLIR